MRLELLDSISAPGRTLNEDRIGALDSLAWVIDGATDFVEQRLLPGPSDAAWLAATLDAALARIGQGWLVEQPMGALAGVLADITRTAALAFERERLRVPSGHHEHPSAAGTIVRLDAARGRLEHLALGDCVLLVEGADGVFHRVGVAAERAGDRAAIARIEAARRRDGHATWKEARKAMLKSMVRGRPLLNQPDGYGALSITLPPAQFVQPGEIAVAHGAHVLIASDGFTRLCDVFGRYDFAALVAAARRTGLAALLEELRAAEREDRDCHAFPRFKRHDDASALLLRVAA
jgi:hypothetical protein